ncbi:MAG: SMP-30/gluconolactonase/LRE family protein [Pseudomonadota bacterium]
MKIEVLVDVKPTIGEGPVWDVQEQRLYWIDVAGARVFRCTAAGRELRAWDLPEAIGSMALRRGGGAVVALASGFHFLDFNTGDTQLIANPAGDKPHTRLNDGKVDAHGRFIVGSMDTREGGKDGSLFRLDPDLQVHRLDGGFMISNGPCWSPDGATFYFSDSFSGEIWAYEYDQETGAVANRRTFTKAGIAAGMANDGSTVDAEGFVWNAQVFAGKLARYAPDGSLDRVIEMPVRKVTSVMFGGPDLDILYVTSMTKPPAPHLPGDGVLRGSLFAIHGLGIKGLPEHRFGG